MDILDLAGLTAIHQRTDEASQTRIVYAEITDQPEKTNTCPHCGAVNSVRRHGLSRHNYHDVPLRGRVVIIEMKLRRFQCQRCRKVFRQAPAGMDSKRSMTTRCVEWIRQQSLRAPFSQVAEESGCSERVVREIADEYIKEQNDNYRPSMPHWLGIDEIYLEGRVEGPLCLLVDLENSQVIDILSDCRMDTLVSWLSSFNETSQLRGVCMDMCEIYRRAVKRVFPDAEIMIDKFHVVRWANKAVDIVRLRVGKLHSSERHVDDRKACRPLLRKQRHSLSAREREVLDGYLSRHQEIATAYYLKEDFFNIYKCGSRSDATKALDKWERSVTGSMRPAFRELLKALVKWRVEILAQFGNEKTLACTEAVNSQVQDISRAREGYSFEVLRGRLLFGRKAHRPLNRGRAA